MESMEFFLLFSFSSYFLALEDAAVLIGLTRGVELCRTKGVNLYGVLVNGGNSIFFPLFLG